MEIKGFFGSMSDGFSNFFKTTVTDKQVNKKLAMFDTVIESQKHCEQRLHQIHKESMAKLDAFFEEMEKKQIQKQKEHKSK